MDRTQYVSRGQCDGSKQGCWEARSSAGQWNKTPADRAARAEDCSRAYSKDMGLPRPPKHKAQLRFRPSRSKAAAESPDLQKSRPVRWPPPRKRSWWRESRWISETEAPAGRTTPGRKPAHQFHL